MYVAKDILDRVLYKAESVEALQTMLKADRWVPMVQQVKDPLTGKYTPVYDESGLEWERDGKTEMCGFIGISVTQYVTISEA